MSQGFDEFDYAQFSIEDFKRESERRHQERIKQMELKADVEKKEIEAKQEQVRLKTQTGLDGIVMRELIITGQGAIASAREAFAAYDEFGINKTTTLTGTDAAVKPQAITNGNPSDKSDEQKTEEVIGVIQELHMDIERLKEEARTFNRQGLERMREKAEGLELENTRYAEEHMRIMELTRGCNANYIESVFNENDTLRHMQLENDKRAHELEVRALNAEGRERDWKAKYTALEQSARDYQRSTVERTATYANAIGALTQEKDDSYNRYAEKVTELDRVKLALTAAQHALTLSKEETADRISSSEVSWTAKFKALSDRLDNVGHELASEQRTVKDLSKKLSGMGKVVAASHEEKESLGIIIAERDAQIVELFNTIELKNAQIEGLNKRAESWRKAASSDDDDEDFDLSDATAGGFFMPNTHTMTQATGAASRYAGVDGGSDSEEGDDSSANTDLDHDGDANDDTVARLIHPTSEA